MNRTVPILTTLTLALSAGCHVSNADSGAAATAGTSAYYYQSGGTASFTGKTATVSAEDQSGVCVADSGTLDLSSSTITSSGSASSTAYSEAYGTDAAILAKTGSTINLAESSVSTSGSGATGVFATGSGSSANLSEVTITTTGAYSPGVAASLAGALTLSGCTVSTSGADSAAIGMADGTGTVTVTGGTLSTSGSGSPAIQSLGAVSALSASLTASAADAAVIQGAHAITLTSSTLAANGSGHRAVLIYQSGAGTAAGSFTMTGGSLTAAGGPVCFVSNIKASITLKGVAVTAGSGVLVEAGATSGWGTAGANGGAATLTANDQALDGDLVTDDAVSSIAAVLENGSTLSGTIDQAALTLDASSQWTVTGTSRLTTLSDLPGLSGTAITNIKGNGHNVYYDATLDGNSYLAGATYTLSGGGQLLPQ